MTRDRDRLRYYIQSLKSVIVGNNIPLPSELDENLQARSPAWGTDDPEDLATVSYREDDLGHLRLHVSMPTAPAKEALNYTVDQTQPTASSFDPQFENRDLTDDVAFSNTSNSIYTPEPYCYAHAAEASSFLSCIAWTLEHV